MLGILLRIPMGTIIGAMVFVGVGKSFSLIQMESSIPLSFLVQVSLGAMIGLSFTKLARDQLKNLSKSIVFIVISVMAMTVITGGIISIFPSVSLPVAILSSAPGGMVEMATMAEALGLEAPAVIFLHFIRLLIVMLLYSRIIEYVSGIQGSSQEVKAELRVTEAKHDANTDNQTKEYRSSFIPMDVLLLVFVALLGGMSGYLTGFPIGALLGTLFAVITIKFLTNKYSTMPLTLKRCVQTFVGANIGLSFTNETFLILPKLLLPGLLLTLLTVTFSLILAYLLSRFLNVDKLTAVCGLAPAGMSEIVIIAESHQVNITTIVTMHLFRIITIVTCIPVIVYQLL